MATRHNLNEYLSDYESFCTLSCTAMFGWFLTENVVVAVVV